MTDIRNNPQSTESPYYFTDEEGHIEGAVNNIFTILEGFEPMDVLNGETVIYDSKGREIIIHTADKSAVEKNEYPKGYQGITYKVGEVSEDFLVSLSDAREKDSLPAFLD
jgi:hypothetical protein